MRKLFLSLILLTLPPAAQSKSYVLKAARIFDGNRISSPGVVVVTGNKIFEVGPSAVPPAGAEVSRFRGRHTSSPGFIDAHTHLSMDDSGNFQRMLIEGLQKTIPERTLLALENLRKTLHAGFTTVRDVGSRDFIDVGLRNAVPRRKNRGSADARVSACLGIDRRPLRR